MVVARTTDAGVAINNISRAVRELIWVAHKLLAVGQHPRRQIDK